MGGGHDGRPAGPGHERDDGRGARDTNQAGAADHARAGDHARDTNQAGDANYAGGARHFHLFVYGTLLQRGAAASLLDGCERLGEATVAGTLYDIDGRYPAVVLYGDAPVQGEVWRCPSELLLRLDGYEGTENGLFRRVAVQAVLPGGARLPCWIYAAGPRLARELLPERRVANGRW
jgi:gamma-glutamylcyclotransferase (GGCT)/AIG2-like uncharacterized protein YtfP